MIVNQKALTFVFKKSRVTPLKFTLFPKINNSNFYFEESYLSQDLLSEENIFTLDEFRTRCGKLKLIFHSKVYHSFNTYMRGCFSPWFKRSFFEDEIYIKAQPYLVEVCVMSHSIEIKHNKKTNKLNFIYKEFFQSASTLFVE